MFVPPRWLPWAALVALVLLFVVLLNPPARQIEVGRTGDSRFLGGFAVSEQSPAANFRWSGANSRLMLHGTGSRTTILALRMHSDLLGRAGAATLRLEQAGNTVASFAVGRSWRVYRLLLPDQPGSLETAALNFQSTLATPATGDGRELGVVLDWLRLTPAMALLTQTHLAATGLRALLLAWALAVIAWAAWRIAHWMLVLPGLATMGLLLYAWYDPYTLAWALPSTPTLLLVAMVALAVAARWAADLAHPARVVPQRGVAQATHVAPPHPFTRSPIPILLGILLLALGLRFYQLADLPYGLWRDEARHGLVALEMLEEPGYWPIFVARPGINMPGLGLYPFALAIHWWGIHPWSMRPITALAGALTVLPLYGLAQRLTGRQPVALLAAALLAVSSWHITLSRYSFPAIFDPLLGLTALWLIVVASDQRPTTNDQRPTTNDDGGKTEDRRRETGDGRRETGDRRRGTGDRRCSSSVHRPPSIVHRPSSTSPTLRQLAALTAAGACLGLAVQTYHTGRVTPVIAVLLVGLLLWRDLRWVGRAAITAWLPRLAALALGFALTIAPLAWYAFSEPAAFGERVGSVFLLGDSALAGRAPLAALDQSLWRHLLMFHIEGDNNGRHHAPDRPLLDLVSGLGLLFGVALLLWRRPTWLGSFLLGWLVLGVAPSLLSVDGPHAMRAIDAAPPACLLAALGLVAVWQRVQADGIRRANLALGMLLLVALAYNSWIYFGLMPASNGVWRSFYPVHTQIGVYLRGVAEREGPQATEAVYVSQTVYENAVMRYLTHGLKVPQFDGARLSRPAVPGARFVLSGFSYQRELPALASYLGSAPTPLLLGPPLPDGSGPAFVVYQVP